MNDTYKPYPQNPRYSISPAGVIVDTETGKKLEIGFTPTNKKYVYMETPEGETHKVYMVYALALTFKGARPSAQHHATLIDPRGGYTADNVCWMSEAQANLKKIKIAQIKRMLEGKTISELESILLMLEGLDCSEDWYVAPPQKSYPPIPELPEDVKAIVYNDAPEPAEPAPKKSIAEILAAAKKEKR